MPYRTVRAESEFSITVERSEFIAKIAPVSTPEEAQAFIDSVRAQNRKARHNCYAYILRNDFGSRFSDDGEPQGTAGQPILSALQHGGLTDAAIVVTRYFGGILLGKGGLTRTYAEAAAGAVSSADIVTMCEAREVSLSFEYPFYDRILRLLPEFGAKTLSQDFADRIALKLAVREELCESLAEKLSDLSNGQITPEFSPVLFVDF